MRRRIGSLLLAGALATAPCASPPSPAEDASLGDAAPLLPGDYLWRPETASAGRLTIAVDLAAQLARVYRGGLLIGVSTISSGGAGHETPTGSFRILQKLAVHSSSRYHEAMPYTQRLTSDGVAIHGGAVPGYPASHGCIHLPVAFARLLFAATRPGTTVVIGGATPTQTPPAPSLPYDLAAGAPRA